MEEFLNKQRHAHTGMAEMKQINSTMCGQGSGAGKTSDTANGSINWSSHIGPLLGQYLCKDLTRPTGQQGIVLRMLPQQFRDYAPKQQEVVME